jgi:hypothetical protein
MIDILVKYTSRIISKLRSFIVHIIDERVGRLDVMLLAASSIKLSPQEGISSNTKVNYISRFIGLA